MKIYSYIIFFSSLIISLLIGAVIIPCLKGLKYKKTSLKNNIENSNIINTTPSMGGFIFILTIIICSFVFLGLSIKSLYSLISMLCFGVIGFIDDFLKIYRKNDSGLKLKYKILLLFLVSCFLSIVAKNIYGSSVFIPFFKKTIDMGLLYIPIIIFIFMFTTISINITEDNIGLSTFIAMTIFVFISFIAYKLGYMNAYVSSYIVAGSLTGFLLYNIHPAKVYMGSVGSLSIGGMLTALLLSMSVPLVISILGIIYIIEILIIVMKIIPFKTKVENKNKISKYSIIILILLIAILLGFVAIISI